MAEPDYHLEAYKLLNDMYKQEDTVFWTRNQMFLLLNSALISILLGILGLQSKSSPPPAALTGLTVPLASICGLGALLCIAWMLIVKRAQGINDHLVVHMKYLEENHLGQITNARWFDKLFTVAPKEARRQPKFIRDSMEVTELKKVLDAAGNPETCRLPRLGSVVRIYLAWTAIAGFFVLLWVVIGVWIVVR